MAAYTTIDNSGSFFNPKLYTGTGSELTVTGFGFQPDFTWLKDRSAVQHHQVYDSVRGAGEVIYPNLINAEATVTQQLKSWTSDGYVIGTDGSVNTSSNLYASWNWKMGTTSGIDTTGSTITPTGYSFDQTAGQSVIAYTGTGVAATVPHGLGVAPSLIITKSLVATQEWCVYHVEMGATKYMFLNETGAQATSSAYWNDVEPTSVLFSIGTAGPTNSSSAMIAYCFAQTQGYSAFGEYKGNGNADGPFIYCGFRPALLLIKIYAGSGTGNWYIFDNKRLGYNVDNNYLYPNTSAAEYTTDVIDLTSNGFKLRSTEFGINADGKSILYAAFAESPFVNSSGVPTNAR